MDSCLFDRPQHSLFGTFFWKSNPRAREPRDLHDCDDQSEQGDKPRISATKQDDLPLQLSDIAFEHIQRDDLVVRGIQPAVSRGSWDAALKGDIDIARCSNEFLESMIVSVLCAGGCGHAAIFAA